MRDLHGDQRQGVPPQEYAEYHGIDSDKKDEKVGILTLLKNAPNTFWSVGVVQFFCWAAFMFMWTYTNGSIAANVFDTPHIAKEVSEGITKLVLDTQSTQYQSAADWVGILFAVQAVGSIIWAAVLPFLGSKRFAYSLSLVLGGIGFMLTLIVDNQYMMFIPFLLIGCAWAAMLALPFTLLTNALSGAHMGTYLGLFNGTICIPQICAALVGGHILNLLSTQVEVAPEIYMLVVAGVLLIVGAVCVAGIKEHQEAK